VSDNATEIFKVRGVGEQSREGGSLGGYLPLSTDASARDYVISEKRKDMQEGLERQ
jgi:hypothetical protein